MTPGITYTDEEYREAAKRMRSGPDLTVPVFGLLQRVGDGAFVEMTLWVPNTAAQGIRMERDFNRRAHDQAVER